MFRYRVWIAAALAAACLAPGLASAVVPSPTIEGPVTGGRGTPFFAGTAFDLAQVGYVEEEYFISGTATAFTSAAPLGSDGRWAPIPGATAAYKTRIVVERPGERSRFNGTVIVEWLNVSFGLDAAPDLIGAH